MRDDLLDAQSVIDWAVSQIPVLEDKFLAYARRRPYDIVMEPDPKGTGDVLMVFYSLGEPDLWLNVQVGAIIHALRSSLDLLFTSLLARNGTKFNKHANFPIRPTAANFLGEAKRLETQNLLTKSQVTTIKAIRPYARGNWRLYVLSQLDNMRKHRRLIEIRPAMHGIRLPMYIAGTQNEWRQLKSKTILLRFPPGTSFVPTKTNCDVALQIAFDEPTLRLRHLPVVPVLHQLSEVVTKIIASFDTH